LFIFGAVTSLGSGWNAAVPNAAKPAEFWHLEATARNAHVLRATLLEVAHRETRGFPRIPIAVVGEDDGLLGWLLRDFSGVRYLNDASEARGAEIALLPATLPGAVETDLGGSYVGQDFVLTRSWTPARLGSLDSLTWWLEREPRDPGSPAQQVVLWLRQDIYAGVELTAE
jgi:hypothetical protein